MGPLAKDQQKNLMASFEFSSPAIDAGTTFIFGSWVCITNGSGGFSSHLINPTNTKTPPGRTTRRNHSRRNPSSWIHQGNQKLVLVGLDTYSFSLRTKEFSRIIPSSSSPMGLDWDSDPSPVRRLPGLGRRLRSRLGFTRLPEPNHPGYASKPSRLLEGL